MKLGYYPGCSLSATGKEFGESMTAVAPRLGLELVELDDWNCCGASSGHTTNELLGLSLPGRVLAIAGDLGLPLLVPCVGCFKVLKNTQHKLLADPEKKKRVEDVIERGMDLEVEILHLVTVLALPEVLAALEKGVTRPLGGLRILPYYGCVTLPPRVMGIPSPENPQGLDAVLEVLGADHPDWPGKIECCGASLSFTRTDIVERLVDGIVRLAAAAGADALATACPLCQANLDMRQKGERPMPSAYITELIGLALGMDEYRTWFRRHVLDPLPAFETVLRT